MSAGRRRAIALASGIAVLVVVLVAQTVLSPPPRTPIEAASDEEQRLLREVFPSADLFSIKGGALPHYKAYRTDADTDESILVGFAFMTHEVEPDEWAYESELEILVGLTLEGSITGIKVIDHYEPFGYFSIEPPEFAEQFVNKSIVDQFEEGRDIDTVSRATISIESAARVIRKSARRIARQHLEQESRSP